MSGRGVSCDKNQNYNDVKECNLLVLPYYPFKPRMRRVYLLLRSSESECSFLARNFLVWHYGERNTGCKDEWQQMSNSVLEYVHFAMWKNYLSEDKCLYKYDMLKHMLTTNGGVGNRSSRQDNSMVLEHRVDQVAHRYRTPTANSSRIQQYPLNVSQLTHTTNLDNSKHSILSHKTLNGGLNISRVRNHSAVNKFINKSKQIGVKEMLVSLGLLCLVSLLLALLSLIFLLKISPVTAHDIRELLRAEQLTVITAEEYVVVYEVTLALCALTLSLNLCCLLVCAIQFLFAVKLVKSQHGGSDRTNKYLQKSSISRICAVGGFFISIPVFLTGIILYTFIQFHSTPAIVTSVFIGLGIIFCGCAMVHNVFIWQREKTNAVKELALQQHEQSTAQHNSFHSIAAPLNTLNQSQMSNYNHSFLQSPSQVHSNGPYIVRPSTTTPPTAENLNLTKMSHPREASGSVSPGMPNATLDMSSVGTTNSPHELSTLV